MEKHVVSYIFAGITDKYCEGETGVLVGSHLTRGVRFPLSSTTARRANVAETDLTQVSWIDLMGRMGNLDRARGIVEGWKHAAAYLRYQAGEHFAAGNDEAAKQLRCIAIVIEKKIPDVDRKRNDDLYAVESALWAEIVRRQTLMEQEQQADAQ